MASRSNINIKTKERVSTMLSTGDWLPFIPPGLSQVWNVLNSNAVDETDACTNYSAIDSIETQEYQQTGQRIQYSRRWSALMAGTNANGNYIGVPPASDRGQIGAFPAIQKYGLVLESSWPQDNSMTFEKFYAPPTAEQQAALLAEGQAWLRSHAVSTRYGIPSTQVLAALQVAPLCAFIPQANPDHCVCVVNPKTMFDSEPHSSDPKTEFIATLPSVSSFHQITLSTNSMNMNVKTMNYNGEVGVFVPVSTPAELGTLNSIFNVNLQATSDGSIPTQLNVIDKP